MPDTIQPKSLRMLALFELALQQLEMAENATSLAPVLRRAALFSCFQRAMFLGLKTLKAFLKAEGLAPVTPKQHLEMACLSGWIEPEEEDTWWVLLMAWLNCSEIYEEEQANQLEIDITQHLPALTKLFVTLSRLS